MSASREKKQRQGAGPSDKAVQAQQEQAQRKRKTITYTIIGVVAVVLVAALLIWNTGFFQRRATAATVGGKNLSVAEMSFYYYAARSTYTQFGSEYAALLYGLDTTKADADQFYNEEEQVTWRDFLLESALTRAQQTLALYDQAVAAGHTEAEVRDYVNSDVESMKSAASSYGYSYEAFLQGNYGPYMTAGVFEKLVTRNYMANLASTDKYDELFDSYTQEDLDKYYSENADTLDTFEYSFLTFVPETVETKDADGNDLPEDEVTAKQDEANAAAKAKAEEALAAYEGGSSVADVISSTSPTSSGDHTSVVGSSNIPSAYREDLLKLGKDKAALVAPETTSTCYVVVFHGRSLLADATRDVRHILVRAENTTDANGYLVAPTDEAWNAAKAKMDEIQAAWDSGAKTEDAFAELANQHSDDGGSNTKGGLYENIAISDSYVPEFLDWIYADGRQPGDVGLVQHSATEGSSSGYYGYHLMYLVGDNEPVWMRTAREAMAETASADWLTDLAKSSYAASLTSAASNVGK